MNLYRTLPRALAALAGWVAVIAAPAAEPFDWSWRAVKADGALQTLEVRCKVSPGCYLYAAETHVLATLAKGKDAIFSAPESVVHEDELMGRVRIYPGPGEFVWRAPVDGEPTSIAVDFQGCRAAAGDNPALCFPPQSLTLLGGAAQAVAVTGELPEDVRSALAKFRTVKVRSGLMDEAQFAAWVRDSEAAAAESSEVPRGFWAILALVVLGGLGLNLTPCVLPMIPVNLAIIGAGGEHNSRWQGLRRGAAYGLGITLAYGALGLLAALTGSRFGTLNSSSWFNFGVGAVFLILGAGLLGAYNLDFSRFSGNWGGGAGRRGGLMPELAAFGLGILAALLAGACVAPVVIGVVVLAVKLYSEGVVWGLGLPFALGLAMALPWPLAGAGFAVLPPPGAWMVKVKVVMGLVIVAAGLYYGYLGWTLRPGRYDARVEFTTLAGNLNEAAAAGEPVLMDFWASWCKNCKAMEAVVHGASAQQALQGVRLVRFQAEKLSDPAVRALLDRWNLPGLPSFVLLAPAEARGRTR